MKMRNENKSIRNVNELNDLKDFILRVLCVFVIKFFVQGSKTLVHSPFLWVISWLILSILMVDIVKSHVCGNGFR
jgi:hypothetical protein